MSKLDEATVLLGAAKRDLDALLGMLQVEKLFADEIFGQHVQQAVEKLAKVWLIIVEGTFPYIHDLDDLFQRLEDAGCDIASYWNLTEFTSFSSQFRYESLIADSDPIDRKSVTTQVRTLYNHVETILQSAKETDDQEGSDENY